MLLRKYANHFPFYIYTIQNKSSKTDSFVCDWPISWNYILSNYCQKSDKKTAAIHSPVHSFIRPEHTHTHTHTHTHKHRQPRCLNSEKHYFGSPTAEHQIHWLSSQAGEERILQMGHVNFPNCVLCKSAHIICSYVRLFQIRNHCRQTNHTAHEKQKVRNYFSPLWITKFSHLGRTQSIRAWKLSLLFRTDNYSR